MAEEDLSHAEVWDDTALVDSWNEAFEEYKKYHSLALKGEKVKLDISKPTDDIVNGDAPSKVKAENEVPSASGSREASIEDAAATGAIEVPQADTAVKMPTMPQALMGSVQNGDLKNLMMSWYYAGYYTGLYEGKQQGYEAAKTK